MKCPECQNDMITAKNGHMCLNCGYAESVDPHKTPLVPEDKATPEVKPVADSPAPVVAEVKPPIEAAPAPKVEIGKPEKSEDIANTTPNSLEDQVKLDIVEAVDAVEKSAVAAEPLAAEPTPLEVVPEPAAAPVVAADIIKTTGRSKVQAKNVDSMAPQGRTKGTLDLKPLREDLVKGAALVSAIDAIGPAPEVEPEPVKTIEDPTPVHVIDHAAEAEEAVAPSEPTPEAVPAPTPIEPVPAASETPVPAAEPAVGPVLQTAPAAKEPLIAKTHPEASSAKTVMMVVGALVIVTCATVAAYYFTSNKDISKVGQNANVSKETSAAGSGESAAVLDKSATPSATPAATPTATPDASSAQARDLKRKTDLAAYAASVKAAATNGYYPTAAPRISGAVVDPTTGKSYAVATTPAASLGSIQYLAGGRCGTTSVTPGKTSTRYISLYTKLETDTAPYCIDVQ